MIFFFQFYAFESEKYGFKKKFDELFYVDYVSVDCGKFVYMYIVRPLVFFKGLNKYNNIDKLLQILFRLVLHESKTVFP